MSVPALPGPPALPLAVPSAPDARATADAAAVLEAARAQHVRPDRLLAFSRHVDLDVVARDAAGGFEAASLSQAISRAAMAVPEFLNAAPTVRRAPTPEQGGAVQGAVPTAPGGGEARVAELLGMMREALGQRPDGSR